MGSVISRLASVTRGKSSRPGEGGGRGCQLGGKRSSSALFLTMSNPLMCKVSINAYIQNDQSTITDKGGVNSAVH